MRFQSQQQQNWIENRCLFGKMVPKHLLQLIFLSVICISSFKILELRFRYELYDSNEILGKESQEQSNAWFRAKMGHLGSACSQTANFCNFAKKSRILLYYFRECFFTFSWRKKYIIRVSVHCTKVKVS